MTILVVDDDELVRCFVKTVLEKEGFQIIEAGDGIDGYKIIQEIGGGIDLLLTDINMPRLNGLVLAQSAAESFPDMPILFMTGQHSQFPDGPMGMPVLKKPFLPHDLSQAVLQRLQLADDALHFHLASGP